MTKQVESNSLLMSRPKLALVTTMAALFSAAVTFILPALASADGAPAASQYDPAASQYGPDTPPIYIEEGGGTVGSLPLTGTDILLLAAAAIVLFAVAATLRRFGRRGEAQ